MRLKIVVYMDNAAFENQGQEVARILQKLTREIEDVPRLNKLNKNLMDINGNCVGFATIDNITESMSQKGRGVERI